MGYNKIRSTSDKIVESPSDRNRKVKSQESGENGSKSWIEKVRQYIGPASAALTMGGLAVQGISAISGVGGSTPEASGTALALRGCDYAMRPPAFPGQRAEFIGKSPTEPYVPAPRPEWLSPPKGPTVQEIWPGLYEEMVKGLEEKGQASKNSLQEEAQEIYNGETSSEQAKLDKHKSRKLLSSRKEKIAAMQALIDKAKENSEPLQSLGKMLNEKQVRVQSLLESDSKIPAARTLLSDEQSTCQDPCSETPASVDCIKQCTPPVATNPSVCLDVSLSEVHAKLEPIPGHPAPHQEVLLNYTLSAQNNCPQIIKDVKYQVQGLGNCLRTLQSFWANPSSLAPGDVAGVKAGQDPSMTASCWGSPPSFLSSYISASGTDTTTNVAVSSPYKTFIVLGDRPWVMSECHQKCPPATDTPNTPATDTPSTPTTDTPSTGHKGPNAGAVAGGVIGGVSALALAWHCCYRRKDHPQPIQSRSDARGPRIQEAPRRRPAAGDRPRPPEQNQPPARRMELVGQKQFGKYQVKERLGEGAFGAVYRCRHPELGIDVAIKVLHEVDRASLQAFREEARIIAQLEHPHIVGVRDFGVESGEPYLVMDYVKGDDAGHRTLKEAHPEGKPVPPERVAIYVKHIAKALTHAHSKNVIHRDIKLANLLLGKKSNEKKTVLVGDFGLAKILRNPTFQNRQGRYVAGTPAYMAPEQWDGNPCKESDQYALGVVVYRLLSGHLPFEGRNIETQHKTARPKPISNISPEIQSVIFRALEKDPRKRFESVEAFEKAFQQAVGMRPVQSGRMAFRHS